METPPGPLPISAPILELGAESAVARERNASGIWSIDGDRLSHIESFDVGPAVVLVPTEDVTILIADLPINGRAKQLAALPFAIEDRIAQPIEDVHVALGVSVAPQRFVAGAMRHATMAAWTLRLIDAGLDRAALVPDALALPVPGEGSWAVDLAAGRALVRAADGTGLALPIALLEHAWRAAGEPRCIAYGDALPAVFGAPEVAMERAPLAARLLAPALNLRQGRYAAPRAAFNPLWRRIALVAAIGAGAHAAIAAADTLALSRIAADHVANARTLVAAQAPGIALGDDLAASMAEIMPASTGRTERVPAVVRACLVRAAPARIDRDHPQSQFRWRGQGADRRSRGPATSPCCNAPPPR